MIVRKSFMYYSLSWSYGRALCIIVCHAARFPRTNFQLVLGVRILCFKISELCYALMLTIYANYAPQISHYAPEICHYASKLNHFFKSQTARNDRPPSFSMLSGSALVLLELSEASSPESSTFSPSLETVVNLVPEATLLDRLLVLQPGSLRFLSSHVKLHMRNTHRAKK